MDARAERKNGSWMIRKGRTVQPGWHFRTNSRVGVIQLAYYCLPPRHWPDAGAFFCADNGVFFQFVNLRVESNRTGYTLQVGQTLGR